MTPLILRRHISLSDALLSTLLFCYFVFSSAELLHIVVGVLKPKIGLIAASLLAGWMILERKAGILPWPLFKAFLFILASSMISAIPGAAPFRSLGYIGVYLINSVLYFWVPFQILQIVDVRRFFRIYWSAFVVIGFYAALQVSLSLFGVYDPFALQRIGFIARGQAWMYEPSYYALYMVPYVMFHNGCALLREKGESSWYARLKLCGQNLLLVISTSTGMLVTYPVFLTLFCLGTFSEKLNLFHFIIKVKLKKAILAFFLSLTAITLIFYETTLHTLFKFFYFGFQNHISFSGRWAGIVASFKIFLKSPILGVGIGGVGPYLFKEYSIYDDKIKSLEELEMFDPTNCLTEILASLGLVGLIAFIYLGFVFYQAYQQVLTHPSIDRSSKKMATALFFSLLIMIFVLQINQGLFRPYVWIHMAAVYGYLFRLKESQNTTSF